MTLSMTMSAAVPILVIILILFCTALNASESNGLQWKDTGEEFVIQCRSSEPGQEYLEVMKGLNEDVLVYSKKNKSEEDTIPKDFTNRLQVHGKFPNIDILIKNLISEDTGPYWCMYKMSDQSVKTKGRGSMLLVVKGDGKKTVGCNPSKENMVLMFVVIATAVVLSIIMGVLIWLIKTKTAYTTRKEGVYEEMSGTLRR